MVECLPGMYKVLDATTRDQKIKNKNKKLQADITRQTMDSGNKVGAALDTGLRTQRERLGIGRDTVLFFFFFLINRNRKLHLIK